MHEIKLNTARNALRLLIRTYNIKELFVPYYICPVVRDATLKERCKIIFYHINDNFFPTNDAHKSFKTDSFILYPNYFGISAKNVYDLASDYKNLIIDNAHAFFMNQNVGLASFVSLRKFFNVPDGSILYTKDKLNYDLEIDEDRKVPQNESEFLLNESLLNRLDIKLISKQTSTIFDTINLNNERERRLENFNKLHSKLNKSNNLKFTLTKDDTPYIYPYLINEKDVFNTSTKNLLTSHDVLRFWNNLPKNFLEYKFYKYLMAIKI